jgi:hypothetical protein
VRIKLTLAGAVALLAEPPETPAACLVPASEYLTALEAAPGEVRLADHTPISSCLVDDQASGALQTVGKSIIDAATELNREILRSSDQQTIVRLGYLVGAVQQGASGTGGIHSDLVLRLDSAARYSGPAGEPFDAAFERAFGQGYAAGQAGG